MSIQPIGASTSAYVPPQAGAVRQAEGQSDTLKAETAKAEAAKAAANASGVQGSSAVQNPNQPNATAKPTREELDHAVKQIQDVVKPSAQNLQISIDEDVNMTVVKVVDGESKKVIRQIPSEEVVEIAKALDKLQGLFVKQQA
jgi:flagellar protein FlaG